MNFVESLNLRFLSVTSPRNWAKLTRNGSRLWTAIAREIPTPPARSQAHNPRILPHVLNSSATPGREPQHAPYAAQFFAVRSVADGTSVERREEERSHSTFTIDHSVRDAEDSLEIDYGRLAEG